MKWFEDNDLHSRGLMINFMRGGYPQGEALLKAIKETEIKWASPGPSMGRRERSRSPRRGAGGGGGSIALKKTRLGKTQARTLENKGKGDGKGRVTYANMLKGGKKTCLAYNLGNCRDDKCPYNGAHVCNVVGQGRICGGKHPSKNHSFGIKR